MSKIEEAREILKELQVPAKQQADLCCYVLLAMADIKEDDEWSSAVNGWIRIHDVIAYTKENYGVAYAENSRETFRKQAMHHFRNAAFIEDNGKATITIDSDSELIDEQKFVGKRKYLDQLIYQINHSYANNCYDAAAVLMRRLFEVLLVLSYQNYGIDDQIKDSTGKGYIMLDGIVKNAKNNQILKISRIKSEFDTFRMVGNFSAHNITYTAGKKDIDDIKLNYRVMLEELYSKAGLIT